MNIQGTHTIACSPAQVFTALTDPGILQRAIPVVKMEKTGADEYNAHLKIGLASIREVTSAKCACGTSNRRTDLF